MKQHFTIIMALCIGMMPVACNKSTAEQMAMETERISVEVDPGVLTEVDGKVEADLRIIFPEKYFNRNVRMKITPVLVYIGGEMELKPFEYQGEKIYENNKTVSYKGASLREKVAFDYSDKLRRSRLELRPVISVNGSSFAAQPFTVALGINTTASSLASTRGRCDRKPDGYQEVLHRTAEAQILYDVNSSTLKKSLENNASIDYYQDALERYKENDRYTIKGTQIVSYTSPEGGKKLNDKLSGKRSETAREAWKTMGKDISELDELDVRSIGQDWEGFKSAVAKSDIRDKDLILRVLSMYDDPAIRESEIRNLAAIYSELKAEVFPELRRSRFITNLDFRNYSDEDLRILSEQRIYMLDEPGLLRIAAITDNAARKDFIYNFAFEKFGSKTALFNIVAAALDAGNPAKATVYLDKLNDEDDPEVINARGCVELYARNWYKAEDLFEKAATEQSKQNLGTLYMLQGKYEKASAMFSDDNPDKSVALIMAGKYDDALRFINGTDARSEYLRAIVCARKGEASGVRSHLAEAVKDAHYARLAETDVEFAKFQQKQ